MPNSTVQPNVCACCQHKLVITTWYTLYQSGVNILPDQGKLFPVLFQIGLTLPWLLAWFPTFLKIILHLKLIKIGNKEQRPKILFQGWYLWQAQQRYNFNIFKGLNSIIHSNSSPDHQNKETFLHWKYGLFSWTHWIATFYILKIILSMKCDPQF